MAIQRPVKAFDLVVLGAVNEDWIAGASRMTSKERERFRECGPDIEWGQETVVSLEKFDALKAALPEVEWRTEIGGSAINVADAISRLPLRVRIGVVGVEGLRRRTDATLPRIALSDRGINVDFLREASESEPLGQCMSIVDDAGERTLITAPCANRQIIDVLDNEQTIARLASARVLHVTSLLDDREGLQDAPTAKVAEVLRKVRARSPDTVMSIDPGFAWSNAPTENVLALLEMADLLFFNRREFQVLSERLNPRLSSPGTLSDPQLRADTILERCGEDAALAVLKLTGATQLFTRRNGRTSASKIFRGPTVNDNDIEDSTGAGDLFAAGVLGTVASPQISGQMGIALGMRFAAMGLIAEGKANYDGLGDVMEQVLTELTGLDTDTSPRSAGQMAVAPPPWQPLLMASAILAMVLSLVVACALVFGPLTGFAAFTLAVLSVLLLALVQMRAAGQLSASEFERTMQMLLNLFRRPGDEQSARDSGQG